MAKEVIDQATLEEARKSLVELRKNKLKRGDEIIDLRDKKTVYATASAPFHEQGSEITMHPKAIERLIKNGLAMEDYDEAMATEKPEKKTSGAVASVVTALIFLFCGIFQPAHSQSGVQGHLHGTTYGNPLDTIIDAGTKFLTVSSGLGNDTTASTNVTGYYKIAHISLTSLNISGTTAYTATLQHSLNNGKTWFTIPTDSVIVVSGAKTVGWRWLEYGDNKTRVQIVGIGTQHTSIAGEYLYRKPQ